MKNVEITQAIFDIIKEQTERYKKAIENAKSEQMKQSFIKSLEAWYDVFTLTNELQTIAMKTEEKDPVNIYKRVQVEHSGMIETFEYIKHLKNRIKTLENGN